MKEEIIVLIEQNKNLIYSIASKYSNYYLIEDLFQVGVIGLINAYKHYKKDRNSKFSTYAFQYIRGEIIEYVNKDRAIKVSDNNLKIYKTYEKSKEYLVNKLHREPNLDEISEFMEMKKQTLLEAINSTQCVLSLDKEINEEQTNYFETVGKDNREEVDNYLDLKEAMSKLSKEEKSLIEYRFFNDYTQSETAGLMGISQVQVSRSEKLILSKMKKHIVT